ncbi:MAG TPA: glycerophosphodiester phosphodiesterase family protein [Thermotogota bacterium]|nr:glycerophosphodiester phosphodiesterase family protein [Thermotogota bacterium]
MKVLAHRGVHHDFLENSLQAFQAAKNPIINGVELDIRLSKEGEVVVFHDEDLDRLFGEKVKIADLSLAQINEISSKESVIIPSLKQVFDLLLENAIINVEIKEPEVVFPLIDLIKTGGYSQTNLIFSSFIHNTLPPLKDAFHDAKIGLLIGDEPEGAADPMGYIQSAVQIYQPYSLHLPIQAFEKFEAETLACALTDLKEKTNIQYAWWTVNTDAQIASLKTRPCICDYIISDQTEFIVRSLKEENK